MTNNCNSTTVKPIIMVIKENPLNTRIMSYKLVYEKKAEKQGKGGF
ncbi:hypothetical protein [Rickettsia massiliae]|nr:hypothetical protein [Rickettsia massiliae]